MKTANSIPINSTPIRVTLFLVVLLLSLMPARAARNVYVALEINGVEVTGYTSLHSIGGEDVSSGHIECYGANHEIFKSEPTRSSLTHTPFKLIKRMDKASPLLYKALAQSQSVSATIKYFHTNPEIGSTERLFTIELRNARISGIRHWSPNNLDPAAASYPEMEEVSIVYNGINFLDEIDQNEYEISTTSTAK